MACARAVTMFESARNQTALPHRSEARAAPRRRHSSRFTAGAALARNPRDVMGCSRDNRTLAMGVRACRWVAAVSRPRHRSKTPSPSGPESARATLAYDPTKTGNLRIGELLGAASRTAPPREPLESVPKPAPIQLRLGPLAVFLLESATEALESELGDSRGATPTSDETP